MINENTILGTIRKGFLDAAYIWKKEFQHIFKDEGVLIFFFLLPLAYPVIYGLIYGPETAYNIPVAIVDDSRTSLSREYSRMLDATPEIAVVSYASNMQEARKLADAQDVFAIISLDKNFEQNIYRGEQAVASLFCDMTSLLYYRNILTAATNVNFTFNEILSERQLVGATLKQQSMAINPVKSTSVSLYNPTSGFAVFILPGIEILVIQQSLLLAIGMLAGTQRERNRNKRLVPENHHYFGTFRIVLGKALSYFTIAVLTGFWTVGVVPKIFGFPTLSEATTLVVFMLPFLAGSIFLGMTLSALIKGREMPMLFFVFMSVPLLFLSGVSWPWSDVPLFWKGVAGLFPSTYAIQGLVQLESCGARMDQVHPLYTKLWIQAIVYFITTCMVYRYQLIQTRKEIDDKIKS